MSVQFIFRAPYTKTSLLRSQAKKMAKEQSIKLSEAQEAIAQKQCSCSWSDMMRNYVAELDHQGRITPPFPHDWITFDIRGLETQLESYGHFPTLYSMKAHYKRSENGVFQIFVADQDEPGFDTILQFDLTAETAVSLQFAEDDARTPSARICEFIQALLRHLPIHLSPPARSELMKAYDLSVKEGRDPSPEEDRLTTMIERNMPYEAGLAACELLRTFPTPYIAVVATNALIRPSDKERILKAGIEIGEAKLGMPFQEYPEALTWDPETRDIMRSILQLAMLKEEEGDEGSAIDLYSLLLRKNPDDNQGVRYLLSRLLAARKRYQEMLEVLAVNEDQIDPVAGFGWASAEFLLNGRTDAAEKMRREVATWNPCFPQAIDDINRGIIRRTEGAYEPMKLDGADYAAQLYRDLWQNSTELQKWWGAEVRTQ